MLSILEYYAYSISSGQAAAHGGHAIYFPEAIVVLLNNHVSYTYGWQVIEKVITTKVITR